MTRLAQTEDLTDIQSAILSAVHDFVENEIIPAAQDLEHADEYPQAIVDGLKELGVFGIVIPEEYGGLGESLTTYALVVEVQRHHLRFHPRSERQYQHLGCTELWPIPYLWPGHTSHRQTDGSQ